MSDKQPQLPKFELEGKITLTNGQRFYITAENCRLVHHSADIGSNTTARIDFSSNTLGQLYSLSVSNPKAAILYHIAQVLATTVPTVLTHPAPHPLLKIVDTLCDELGIAVYSTESDIRKALEEKL